VDKPGPLKDNQSDSDDCEKFDYIVIGSGAGGGPLACNLALEGFRVLLLEAGGDNEPCDYKVPAFHARASENEALRWDYFVHHYDDKTQQERDCKFSKEKGGVLYPRSGTLGGCTAHNAMVLMYPHNSDWDYIAKLMDDPSWKSRNMQKYFQRLERCEYVPRWKIWSHHGFDGWLPTNQANRWMLLKDKVLTKLTAATVLESRRMMNPLKRFFLGILKFIIRFDPNDWRLIRIIPEGLYKIPLTTQHGKRVGAREYILRVREQCPDKLIIRTHSLVQRILLNEHNKAYGVEYRVGAHQYRADPRHNEAVMSEAKTVCVEREVIIAAGAFNTPQLLMLSGIGPREELEKHNIEVKVELPGVGKNLQDRYEVVVVTKLKEDIPLIKGMKLRPPEPGEEPDPQYTLWLQEKGPYTTNGATIALITRSSSKRPKGDPDLLIFGLLGNFSGYYPGYSNDICKENNRYPNALCHKNGDHSDTCKENIFTWAILKAHTSNTGVVTLQSNDPRDVPHIKFNYFPEDLEGTNGKKDLDSVAEGVETVRNIIGHCRDLIDEEILPGTKVRSRDEIRQFIKDQAWGHHASCTCKLGPKSDEMAVVDNRFNVYGTTNLRIVDASIFPKIPGFFIVCAIYMISEKASEIIIEDARKSTS
jgi:choline dehydrogenase